MRESNNKALFGEWQHYVTQVAGKTCTSLLCQATKTF